MKDLEYKAAVITRLKRIEGQVRGIQTMIENDRHCAEVLQQLSSIRSAVQSTSMEILKTYASDCLLKPDQDENERNESLQEIIALISRTTS